MTLTKIARRVMAGFMVLLFVLPLAGLVRGALGGTQTVALYDAAGKKYSLESFRNRPLALVFWATWCSTCERTLKDTAAQRPGKLTVLGVHETVSEQNGPKAKAEVTRRRYPVKVLFDDLGTAGHVFGIQRLPTVIVLNRHHQVVKVLTGPQRPEVLRQALQAAV